MTIALLHQMSLFIGFLLQLVDLVDMIINHRYFTFDSV